MAEYTGVTAGLAVGRGFFGFTRNVLNFNANLEQIVGILKRHEDDLIQVSLALTRLSETQKQTLLELDIRLLRAQVRSSSSSAPLGQ